MRTGPQDYSQLVTYRRISSLDGSWLINADNTLIIALIVESNSWSSWRRISSSGISLYESITNALAFWSLQDKQTVIVQAKVHIDIRHNIMMFQLVTDRQTG